MTHTIDSWISQGRIFLGCLTFACALAAALSPGASALAGESIEIEAEDFFASVDAPGGIMSIEAVQCDDASGGSAVDGMDAKGDWIELSFSLRAHFCFAESLRSAGSTDFARKVAVLIRGDFEDEFQFTDTLLTLPGTGIG